MCAKAIHRENKPLLDLPDSHPARAALTAHLEARIECVGREIPWPNMAEVPIEQEWFSQVDQRRWTFSGFAYAFISFDLVLDGWLQHSREIDQFERSFICELPRLRKLLDECEQAARSDENWRVLPLIEKAREFFSAYEASIYSRVGNELTENSDCNVPVRTLWLAGKPRTS